MVYFMENPIKMDDLGIPLFLETPIFEFKVNCQYFFEMDFDENGYGILRGYIKLRYMQRTISFYLPLASFYIFHKGSNIQSGSLKKN